MSETDPDVHLSETAASDDLRAGETSVPARTLRADTSLVFIGRILTPWMRRRDCPRQGRRDGPVCRLELEECWVPGLAGIERYSRLELLYWLDRSRRDLLLQNPARDGVLRGTFSLRSPVRPNPIGSAIVSLVSIDAPCVFVRGLDCVSGTPLIDIKPDRCLYSPAAAGG